MLTDFRLQVFVSVARELSFTRSAHKLNITQPAVTKHIKELEKQIGVPLFVRQGSRISLTQDGTRLLSHAESILSSYSHLNELFARNFNGFQGKLRLGASTTISQYLLPRILANFRKTYSGIEVELTNGNSQEIEQQVVGGVVEFGIVEDNHTNPSLHYEHFTNDEIILVTASANRTLRSPFVTLAELSRLPLVVREPGSGTLAVIERRLAAEKITLRRCNITMQLGSSESIKNYLLYSDSVAFISRTAAEDYIREGKLRVVKIDGLEINRTFRFISMHGSANRLAMLFRDFAMKIINI